MTRANFIVVSLAVFIAAGQQPPDMPGTEFGMTAGEVKALMRSRGWLCRSANPATPSGAEFLFYKRVPEAGDSAFMASVGAKGLFQTIMRFAFPLSDTGRKRAFEKYDRLRGDMIISYGRPDPVSMDAFLEYELWARNPLTIAVFINEAKANDMLPARHYEVWRMATNADYVVEDQ